MNTFLGFVFASLIIATISSRKGRGYYRNKSLEDWTIDCLNLFIQGTLIPLLQPIFISVILARFFPSFHASLDIGPVASFLLNFVIVDYCYYWNHRLFHRKRFFPVHLVHHTAKQMDVLATSRNTLWTSFFIVYLWANGIFIYLLKEPEGFILAIATTAALDCWRHSTFFTKKLQKFFSSRLNLITPIDHAWHHSNQLNSNYGANLNLFDKIHGTYQYHSDFPEKLGVKDGLTFFQKLINPFRYNK